MKYLHLAAPLWSAKNGKLMIAKGTEKLATNLIRNEVADVLWFLISFQRDEKGNVKEKPLKTIEDHRKLGKLKDKLILSEDEIVAMGNDLFDFLKSNFTCEGLSFRFTDQVLAIDSIISECAEQDEEKAEMKYREWEASGKKAQTVQEFYEGMGVELKFEKEDEGLEKVEKKQSKPAKEEEKEQESK